MFLFFLLLSFALINYPQIFVGGLDPNISDEDLRQPFSQYGEIVSVKIPVGKGCGFVQFANRCSFHIQQFVELFTVTLSVFSARMI